MTFREFLESRERELVSEIEGLRGDLAPKEAELAEIRRAKVAIGMLHQVGISFLMAIEAARVDDRGGSGRTETCLEERPSKPPRYAALTMKQLVVKALVEHFHQGATTRELLDFFRDAWDREVSRASLTPQLSRLFQDRIIGRGDDRYWFLLANHKPAEKQG